ncbi:glycerophosphocholine acyltransferase 1 [Fagus crenata]
MKRLWRDMNGDSFQKVKQRFKDQSMKVAQTKEMLSKQAVQAKEILSKQAVKIAKQAEEHERFINKDFCYYANTIFLVDLLLYRRNEKLFMVCFSFAEGPLAWALIVWRCSLVFSSVDKINPAVGDCNSKDNELQLVYRAPPIDRARYSFLHHSMVGSSWDPATFAAMHPEGTSRKASWPYVE